MYVDSGHLQSQGKPMSARNHKAESARKDQREGETWVFAIK